MDCRSRFALLVLLCLAASAGVADELKDFKSDGCSAFPDGTFEQNKLWRACCVAHDVAYWKGGSSAARKLADDALRVCVAKSGEPEIARLMLAGVRVGGTPWSVMPYRWAYGWSMLRGYKELTEDEAALVAQKLEAAREFLETEGITVDSVAE